MDCQWQAALVGDCACFAACRTSFRKYCGHAEGGYSWIRLDSRIAPVLIRIWQYRRCSQKEWATLTIPYRSRVLWGWPFTFGAALAVAAAAAVSIAAAVAIVVLRVPLLPWIPHRRLL